MANHVGATHITSNTDGHIRNSPSMPTVTAFGDSQFFLGRDGRWLMVDYLSGRSGDWWSWYVIECK